MYDVSKLGGDANVHTPTSAAELSDPANAGKVAILSGTFDLGDTKLAAGQILVPNGGALTGENVDLNGATIINNGKAAFAPSFRFSALHKAGCLSPELFGAGATGDDADAIEAMIVNGERAISAANAEYNFNTGKKFDRGGVFKWNGNSARIESKYSSGSGQYLMTWEGTRHEICDLEIDGNDTTERLMKVVKSDFYIDGVDFHHFRTEQTDERAINYWVHLYTESGSDFKIYNSKLHDVKAAASSLDPLVVTGITRQLWFSYYETDKPAKIHIKNSEIYNTQSNNGDGIHLFGVNNDFDHQVNALIEDSKFWGNLRRDIKMQTEGLQVHRCEFTKSKANETLPYGGKTATSIGISLMDALGPSDFHDRAEVIDSKFTNAELNNSMYVALHHARGAVVRGNTFELSEPLVSGAGVSIQAKQSGNIVENNTFKNTGVYVAGTESTSKPSTIRNNQFSWTIKTATTGNGYFGSIFRNWSSNLPTRDVVIESNTATIDVVNASGAFWGFFSANAGASSQNVAVRSNTVTFTGNSSSQKFMYVKGDFGSSNEVKDNVVNGINVAGAFHIEGDKSFQNVNNTDGAGKSLTVQ